MSESGVNENKRTSLIEEIHRVFAQTPRPSADQLVRTQEGNEPRLIQQALAHVPEWTELDSDFVDQLPDGFGSALSFFSSPAFRYYIPAYMVADLTAGLKHADVVFHLIHGLSSAERDIPVNRKLYGQKTWFQYSAERFSVFNYAETETIVKFLQYRCEHPDTFESERQRIHEALSFYWIPQLR